MKMPDTIPTTSEERIARPTKLSLTGISKHFGSRPVLTDVTLDVFEGEFVALLGPSGCGKTTTLRVIAGFERSDAGTVEIAGTIVSDNRHHLPAEKRRAGMVFQDFALFPHLSVGQNVGYGLPRRSAIRIAEMLELVGLEGQESWMPHQLSGGQQQRVALARALAPRPEIILLDEPFSNLDPAIRARVRTDVHGILRKAGATAILVTHDHEEALSLADRVAVIFEGRIAQIARPEVVYHRPASRDVAAFVGEASFLQATASGVTADSPLGRVELLEAHHGPIDLVLRPESILLSSNAGANAEVISRRFFGHYQLVTIRLFTGLELTARVDGHLPFEAGDHVRASINNPIHALPR